MTRLVSLDCERKLIAALKAFRCRESSQLNGHFEGSRVKLELHMKRQYSESHAANFRSLPINMRALLLSAFPPSGGVKFKKLIRHLFVIVSLTRLRFFLFFFRVINDWTKRKGSNLCLFNPSAFCFIFGVRQIILLEKTE